jgi:hypothetical protein
MARHRDRLSEATAPLKKEVRRLRKDAQRILTVADQRIAHLDPQWDKELPNNWSEIDNRIHRIQELTCRTGKILNGVAPKLCPYDGGDLAFIFKRPWLAGPDQEPS